MQYHLKVSTTVIVMLSIAAVYYQPASAKDDFDDDDEGKEAKQLPLIFAWTLKPPYVTSPSNGSIDNEAHGMIRDAVLWHVTWECSFAQGKEFKIITSRIDNEFEMIDLLRQNKVHIALPIFEHPTSRRYNEFPFLKIDDYPGTEYIIARDDVSAMTVVLEAVVKAWPLLAVTMVLTAIAGVIIWALVCIILYS